MESNNPNTLVIAATWQERLLPLMIWMLVGLTIFFFLVTYVQLYDLNSRIEQTPPLKLPDITSKFPNEDTNAAERITLQRLSLAAALEANTVARRYHQANVLLMSRVWAHYLGFVTGMTLALVGAAFVLGQLRVPITGLESKSGSLELSLRSASPGVIMSVLGVTLMITTIITHREIETQDTSVYFGEPVELIPPPSEYAK